MLVDRPAKTPGISKQNVTETQFPLTLYSFFFSWWDCVKFIGLASTHSRKAFPSLLCCSHSLSELVTPDRTCFKDVRQSGEMSPLSFFFRTAWHGNMTRTSTASFSKDLELKTMADTLGLGWLDAAATQPCFFRCKDESSMLQLQNRIGIFRCSFVKHLFTATTWRTTGLTWSRVLEF